MRNQMQWQSRTSSTTAGKVSAADVALLCTICDEMRAACQTDEERDLAEFAHEMKRMARDMKMERLLLQIEQALKHDRNQN